MKKTLKLLSLAFVLGISGNIFAQDARETSAKINKANQNAVVASYNQPAAVTEAALKERLSKEGLSKMKSSGGYMVYSGVIWSPVSADKMDVYFKVEGKKDQSTITVLASKGYDNFVSSVNDAVTVEQIKKYLNSFGTTAGAYNLGLNIKAQEEVIRKAEKAYNNSVEENKDLLAQKEKIEKKIVESNNEQAQKQKALNDEKTKLTAMQNGKY